MAVPDQNRLIKILFEAVNRFYKDPSLQVVRVSSGHNIYKKPTLKLLRQVLPQYKVFQDDDQFIKNLYENQTKDLSISRLLNQPTSAFPEEVTQNFDKTQSLPENQQETAQNEVAEKHEKQQQASQTQTTQPVPDQSKGAPAEGTLIDQKAPSSMPSVPFKQTNLYKKWSGKVQGLQSKSASAVRTFVSRYPTATASVVSGTISGVVGSAYGLEGAITGVSVGATIPPIVKSRLGNAGIRAGGNRISNGFSNAANMTKLASRLAPPQVKIAGAIILILAALIFTMFIQPKQAEHLKNSSLLSPGADARYSYNPLAGNAYIGQCKFSRGDQFPIPSNKLKLIFEEVAAKSGVPATVLASVAMHENKEFTSQAGDNHAAFFETTWAGPDCEPYFKTSYTGALGLMQIQPPFAPQNATQYNPSAADITGITAGVGFMGKSYGNLTIKDYCDIKTNVYMAAGILINKNGGTPPTTDTQIKTAVCNYFWDVNNCTYVTYLQDGTKVTPNYGDEAAQDFLNCQTSLTAPPPIAGADGFVFYCQASPMWQQSGCSLGSAGCGPTSMAMIASTQGLVMDPMMMDSVFQQVGARSCADVGSSIGNLLSSAWFNARFTYEAVALPGGFLDLTEAQRYLSMGYLVLASSQTFPCPNPGWCRVPGSPVNHIFVVDKVDIPSNRVNVRDSINCQSPNYTENTTWRTRDNTSFPWYWAYAIKKREGIILPP